MNILNTEQIRQLQTGIFMSKYYLRWFLQLLCQCKRGSWLLHQRQLLAFSSLAYAFAGDLLHNLGSMWDEDDSLVISTSCGIGLFQRDQDKLQKALLPN